MSAYTLYKITSNDETITDQYVGCTTNFKKRCYEHKSSLKRGVANHLYSFMRTNGGFDQFSIDIVSTFEGIDKRQMEKIETSVIKTLAKPLNSKLSYVDLADYKNYKEYYMKHHKHQCDCGSVVSSNNKARHFKTKRHRGYMDTISCSA
jgi:hypothetical protein